MRNSSRDSAKNTIQTSRQKSNKGLNEKVHPSQNNFMNKSGSNFKVPERSSKPSKQQLRDMAREQKLQNITNSVTGFYKQPSLGSNDTHNESNLASVLRANKNSPIRANDSGSFAESLNTRKRP